MDLWVRSYDGVLLEEAKMVKVAMVKGFSDASDDAEFGIVVNNDYSFGEFKTKQRALEVLDEIHTLLLGLVTPSDFTYIGKQKIKKYTGIVYVSEKSNKLIYELPKE